MAVEVKRLKRENELRSICTVVVGIVGMCITDCLMKLWIILYSQAYVLADCRQSYCHSVGTPI